MSNQVLVYVDAYNFYHSMKRAQWPEYLKWTSYRRLAALLTHRDDLVVTKVFSAEATHFPESLGRQHLWFAAQRSDGCELILGNFKKKARSCRFCHAEWMGHEEKETDVNIGIHLVQDTWLYPEARIILITNDTDLLPALKMVKGNQPSKRITLATVDRLHPSLARIASDQQKVSQEMMRQALMPAEIQGAHSLIKRPEEYAPPPEIRVPER